MKHFLVGLLVLAWSVPAFAAISPPVNIGANVSTGGAPALTVDLTYGSTCAAGDVIIVVATSTATTLGALTVGNDTAGNTFTALTPTTLNGQRQGIFYSQNTLGAPAATVLTLTSPILGRLSIVGLCVAGLDLTTPFVEQAAGAGAATGTGETIVSSSLPATEHLAVGYTWAGGGSTDITESAVDAFTHASPSAVNASNNILHLSYRITSASGVVTYNPTFTSRSHSVNLAIFLGASGAPAAVPDLLTLGVGQ